MPVHGARSEDASCHPLTRQPVIGTLIAMTTSNRGTTTATLVAAVVAIVLSAGIIALALINPYALIGLPPVLLAIAAIVRAVTGARSSTTTR